MADPGPSVALVTDALQPSTIECSTSDARLQYVIDMRRRFSPPGMLHPDGSINQDFFKPKRVVSCAQLTRTSTMNSYGTLGIHR